MSDPRDLELLGMAEIASLLGVTRQRANQLFNSHKDFPAPVAELKAGRIWRQKDVVAWAEAQGRL